MPWLLALAAGGLGSDVVAGADDGLADDMRSSPLMRFSYQLLPEQPLEELLGTLELLDQLGFWACYSADETYHKDMWSLFAAGAARTSRLRLGAYRGCSLFNLTATGGGGAGGGRERES